jgi:hypothetical protein
MNPELACYIRLRDGFLATAEQVLTGPRLDRAWLANDAVESFLFEHPAGSVYNQHGLTKSELEAQKQRCAEVKRRIEELRSRVAVEMDGQAGDGQPVSSGAAANQLRSDSGERIAA